MTGALRNTVYVHATLRDSTDPRLGTSVDIFAQSVSEHLRSLLGAKGDTLPTGDRTIGWRGIEPHIALGVTARSHAAPTFQLITPRTDSVAAALLRQAAVAAQEGNDGFLWPDDVPGDSLIFGLAFAIAPEASATPHDLPRVAFPVFSVTSPQVVPAEQLPTKSHPTYPTFARTIRAEGFVILDFVVDTTGRIDIATVHEQWPADRPRPTGDLGMAYDAFLKAVKAWLPSARFAPARIGGCRVRQKVQQPFYFNFA